ncbi:MAG: non-canonical purine NTP pyrophosphatase, RdgB/HAM1 family [candidate division Zixibacteria bacterium HGW-Zixibacteria-1]|nr:MAG: non-canonical purine NTP pyrophosphatase, RdgB/HAM1 family [candidate division Zixibacteria bacterium HGW-Zixibacteria-1]
MQLVLATKNKDKIREIKHLLEELPVTIMTFEDFLDFPDIEETGETLEENAILKARGIAEFTGLAALADDSGLEVDALGGAPGVYSSRYAGPGCTYDDNNRKLLKELEGIPKENRTARFRTVIAIAWDENKVETVEGTVDGFIAGQKTGRDGFGYDPVFFSPPAGKTFAEMTLVEKNKVSHRGKALVKALELLAGHLNRINL